MLKRVAKNLFIAFNILALSQKAVAEDFLLVSSQQVDRALEANDVRKIFLGDKLLWPDGSRIIVVILKKDDLYKMNFIRDIVGMTLRQFDQHWKAKLFSGLGFPPLAYDNPTKMISYLKQEPRAIGLIAKDMNTDLEVIFSEYRIHAVQLSQLRE